MRVLIVSWELPTFDRTSGGLRLFTLMSLLVEGGAACDFLLAAPNRELRRYGDAEVDRYADEMGRVGVAVRAATLPEVLRQHRYDAVVFEFYSGAEQLGHVVRALQPQAALVIDSVDLTYLRWAAMAEVTRKAEDLQRAQDVRRRELATYRRSDLVLTLTADESTELRRHIPGVAVFEVPNIHPMPEFARSEASQPTVLFIGSFTHEPNVDAVQWVASEIWPRVVAAHPSARLQIIGQRAPKDLLPAGSVGTELLGHVPSTAPYLASAWVSIAPLRFGAGMKGKVGEALAAGLPLVTTTFGAQGYRLESGQSAFVVDAPEDYAAALIELLASPDLRQRMGQAGRRVVAEHFSRESVAARIPSLLEAIRAAKPTRRPPLLALRRGLLRASEVWAKHVAWRLRRA